MTDTTTVTADVLPRAVKFVDGSDDLIEGLGIPFGGPAALGGKDLTGEFFSVKTDLCLDWFPQGAERPLLFGHGFDSELTTEVIGRVKSYKETDDGIWVQAQLDKRHRYYERVKTLLDQGAVGFSSGAVDHLYRTTKSGEILTWPWVEESLTPVPANPLADVRYTVKEADLVGHLAVLGIAIPSDDPEPDPEPPSEPDPLTAIKNILTPQALHDAALASGAACRSSETPEPPALGLAIAGKSTEQPVVDLAAIKAQLTETAIALAKELTGQ